MSENKEDNIKNLQDSISKIIGVKTNLKRRKRTLEDIEKDQFINIINSLEKVYARSCLTGELNIDTSNYDETFYLIIDSLLELHYGKSITDIISFYLYDRVEIDGKVNILYDENREPIKLDNAHDLYTLIKRISSNPPKK